MLCALLHIALAIAIKFIRAFNNNRKMFTEINKSVNNSSSNA